MIKNLIVIPYRDRKNHLNHFIKFILPLLNKQLSSVRVAVIEQQDNKLFNRGALINIGYKIYKHKAESIITHDIDLYPTNECIKKYYFGDFDGVHGICCSPCNTLGGIVKMKMDDFELINGFPNNFWGWGVEDKAFQNRIESKNLEIKKSILRNRGDFTKYFHSDESNHSRKKDTWRYNKRHRLHYEKWNGLSPISKKNLIYSSGLNNLKYTISAQLTNNNYDHFLVNIDKTHEGFKSVLLRKVSKINPFK